MQHIRTLMEKKQSPVSSLIKQRCLKLLEVHGGSRAHFEHLLAGPHSAVQ